MKKKLLSKTYLKETTKHILKIYYEDDMYVGVKKILNITTPFILGNNDIGMDNNYYLVEIIPKTDNCALRIFLNDKKEVVEYYFDIIKNSGIDEETNIPYFNDLYLDITIDRHGNINIIDEDELLDALNTSDITKEDYELVLKTKDKLLMEIKNNTNKLLNIDYLKYIGDM